MTITTLNSSVFAEDVLTGKATITKLVKRNPKNGIAEITIEAYNQFGVVLIDVTEAVVKRKTATQKTVLDINEGKV